MRDLMMNAFDLVTAYMNREEVAQALENGDWTLLADFVDWSWWELDLRRQVLPVVSQTIQREGTSALDEVMQGTQALAANQIRSGASPPYVPPEDPGVPAAPSPRSGGFYATARFDMTNPFAIAQAERFAGDLVRQVTRTTRMAIRDTIVDAFRNGVTVDVTARRLRETIGLTRAQARAVANFRDRLERRGDLDESQVDRATRRYYRKTLRRRAQTIARTEIMRASNHGRMEAWHSAADMGLIDLDASTKEWVTAPERSRYGPPCQVCLPMDGVKVVGADSLFSLPDGRQVSGPPAHPNCRCVPVLWPPEPPEDWDPEYPHAQV